MRFKYKKRFKRSHKKRSFRGKFRRMAKSQLAHGRYF